ncbi:DUF916 domain-containing protein [Cellulomonas taurus]|uniref:DUF916 domain-containing protein n=1 Tax=Cellulomonas taurus TaxID=2729175 RepID=UPI00145C6611|nr:DUF916 domain-containing protein [Cellulomonas taurus]
MLVGLLLALVSPAAAQASATPTDADPSSVTWGVAPGDTEHGIDRANYAYTLDPGTVLHDVLDVTNRGSADLHLAVYGADGLTTTSGQLDLLPADQESTDVGRWIVPEVGAIDVPAGTTVSVPFTVTVPADATPGDHSGGILTALSAATGDDGTVRLDRRLALRMHVRVSGELTPGLTVSDLTIDRRAALNPIAGDTLLIRYRLTNSGNTRLVPTDAVAVAGLVGAGRVVDVSGAEQVEVLAGSSVERELTVTGVHTWGRAEVTVRAQGSAVGAGHGAVITASTTRSVLAPPWAALAVLLLLSVVVVTVVLLRRRSAAARGRVSSTGRSAPVGIRR